MFLYIIKNKYFERINLQPLKSYSVKNNIFEADIYLDEHISDFSFKLDQNSLIEFNNTPPETVIKDLSLDYTPVGNFCSSGDLWLSIKDSSLFFTNQELDLNEDTLDEVYHNYTNNYNYYNTSSGVSIDSEEVVDDEPNEFEQETDSLLDDSDDELRQFENAVASAKNQDPIVNRPKWQFKNRAQNPLLLNLQYLIEEVLEKLNRFKRPVLAVLALIAVCVLLFFIWVYHSANTQRTKQLSQIEDRKSILTEVNNYLTSKSLINKSIYIKYGTVVASGLITSGASAESLNVELADKFKDTSFNTNFITLPQLYSKIDTFEKAYNLHCELESNMSNLTCMGIVEDKDSVQEQAFNFYQYNNIVPVTFNLYYMSEINNKITQLLAANPMLTNLTASITGDTLIFTGYIRRVDLASLKSGIHALFTSSMPQLNVVYHVKFIEDILKLQIKQLVLTDYGNSFIDQDSNQYSIGSIYHGFRVKDIQKNYIIFYDGAAKFVYPTPFSENKTENSTDTSNNAFSAFKNIAPSGDDSSYNESTFISAPNTRNAILNEENKKIKNDILRKQAILDELGQAQKNNTNSKLSSTYNDLIDNLNSDLKYEHEELSPK